jgi:hypothetical protein
VTGSETLRRGLATQGSSQTWWRITLAGASAGALQGIHELPPGPGDDGFDAYLLQAVEDGWILPAEAARRYKLHKLIVAAGAA